MAVFPVDNYSIPIEITVVKVPLQTPTGLSWNGSTATWNAVPNASKYRVQLYKNNAPQGEPVETTATSCTLPIGDEGSYSFSVTALGDKNHTDSATINSEVRTFYKVTFATGEGSAVAPQVVEAGGKVAKPADPHRQGYTFDGWFGQDGQPWDFDTRTISGTTTIEARWHENKSTTTLVLSGDASGSGDAFEATYGDTVTLTATIAAQASRAARAAGLDEVAFTVNGQPVGKAKVEGNTATLTGVKLEAPTWNAGDQTVTATYGGSDDYTASSDTAVLTLAPQKLATPQHPQWDGNNATWEAVANATGYTVHLYDDGAEIPGSPFAVMGGDETSKALPLNGAGNYTFKVLANGSGNYADGDLSAASASQRFYSVSFPGTEVPEQTVAGGEVAAEPPAPEKTGYDFGGWYDNEACTGEAWDFSSPVNSNLKLYAKWTPHTYNVTLHTNGGSIAEGEDVTSYTYSETDAAALPTPTRQGYRFDGWYEDEEYSGQPLFAIAPRTAGDKIYYAKWTENHTKVALSVHGEGVSEADGAYSATYGGTVKLTATISDAAKKKARATGDNTVTFYAGVGEKKYPLAETVAVKGDTATLEGVTLSGTFGEGGEWHAGEVTLTAAFSGSADKAASEGETTLNVKPQPLTAPTNLRWGDSGSVAQWDAVANASGYEVTLYHDGEARPEKTKQVDADATSCDLAIDDAGRHTFTVKALGEGDYAASAASADSPALNFFNVRFDDNEGSSVADIVVKEDGRIEEPPAPTREGYTFAGWYKDSHLATPWDFEKDTVTADTRLYAKWVANDSLVTVSISGGGVEQKGDGFTAPYESVVTLTAKVAGMNENSIALEKDKVTFYLGKGNDRKRLGTADVAGDTATLENVKILSEDGKNWDVNLHDITADYHGSSTLLGGSGQTTIDVTPHKLDIPQNLRWDRAAMQWDAVESASSYTVTVYKDGKPVGEPLSVEEPAQSENATRSIAYAAAAAGDYTFTVQAVGEGNYANGDVSTASVAQSYYSVTFDSAGGTGVETQVVANGGTASKPQDPTRTGYTFSGWQKDGSAWDFDTAITGNTTLTAAWEANVYDLHFDTAGGAWAEGFDVPDTYTYGKGLTLPTADNITRAGYDFAGWMDEDGQTVTEITATDLGDKTFTAQWTAQSYGVQFETNGGAWAEDFTAPTAYTYSQGLTLPTAENISKTGYDFAGWYDNEACDGEPITAIAKDASGEKTFYAKWEAIPYQITVNKGEHGTASADKSTATIGETVTLEAQADSGYHFKEWQIEPNTVTVAKDNTFTMPAADVKITPIFEQDSGGGGIIGELHTIDATAGAGGKISPSGAVKVVDGADKTLTITADEGYAIKDVTVDGESVGAVASYTFENVDENHTIHATFKRGLADPDDTGVSGWLDTVNHDAYLGGYPDGTFAPGKNMTRAEVAQMFYNLLLDKNVTITERFDDVPANAWYADEVNALASLGILRGVADGQFAPNRPITRAEFTVIAMRFATLPTGGENMFSDVHEGDWFYKEVVGSIQYGWIAGYADGSFRPNATITRAEVTAIANRMLGRVADEDYIDAHTSALKTFSDLPSSHWAYATILEATNAHDYTKENGGEHWTGLKKA